MSASDIKAQLARHIEAFNRGVRTGDFRAMLAMYDTNAVFELAKPMSITHYGIDAIRRAYRGDPPQGTMSIVRTRVNGQSVTADYIWDAEPARIAGQLTLEFNSYHVTRVTVTFAPD